MCQQAPCSAASVAPTRTCPASATLAPCLGLPAIDLHDTVTDEAQEEVEQATAGLIHGDALEKHVDRLA